MISATIPACIKIINQLSLKKLHIYAHNREIYIVGKVNPGCHADLYDIAGINVKTVRLATSERNSFRVDGIKTGIYLIKISGQDGPATARLLIN